MKNRETDQNAPAQKAFKHPAETSNMIQMRPGTLPATYCCGKWYSYRSRPAKAWSKDMILSGFVFRPNFRVQILPGCLFMLQTWVRRKAGIPTYLHRQVFKRLKAARPYPHVFRSTSPAKRRTQSCRPLGRTCTAVWQLMLHIWQPAPGQRRPYKGRPCLKMLTACPTWANTPPTSPPRRHAGSNPPAGRGRPRHRGRCRRGSLAQA